MYISQDNLVTAMIIGVYQLILINSILRNPVKHIINILKEMMITQGDKKGPIYRKQSIMISNVNLSGTNNCGLFISMKSSESMELMSENSIIPIEVWY